MSESTKGEQKRIVILGQQGAGKTFLFNKLTGNNQPSRLAGSSLTKQITLGYSIHGNGFEVVDTPGFDADEQKVLHAAGIAAGLSYGKMNRIIIIIQCDRDKQVEREIKMVYKCLTRFKENITIYFSFFDKTDGTEETKECFRNLARRKFGINSCLFGTKDSAPFSIIREIDVLLIQESSKPISAELLKSEIFTTFDLIEYKEDQQQVDMSNLSGEIIMNFKQKTAIYIKFINQLSLNEIHFLEILHQLQFYIRKQADLEIQSFEKKYEKVLNEMFDPNSENLQYIPHIILCKDVNRDVYQLFEKIELRMKEHKNSIFSNLRECPHCGQIWFKAFGCDMVTCGQQIGAKFDKVFNFDLRPKIKFEEQNGNLKVQVENKQPVGSEYQVKAILNNYYCTLMNQEIKSQLFIFTFEDFIQLLQTQINENFLKDISQKLDLSQKEEFFSQLTQSLQHLTQIISENKLQVIKSLGCEANLISSHNQTSLISQGLVDFFEQESKLGYLQASILKSDQLENSVLQQKKDCVVLQNKTAKKDDSSCIIF